MDSYKISSKSEATVASVDSKQLELGGDAVELTKSQAQRLEDAGVLLDKVPDTKTNS